MNSQFGCELINLSIAFDTRQVLNPHRKVRHVNRVMLAVETISANPIRQQGCVAQEPETDQSVADHHNIGEKSSRYFAVALDFNRRNVALVFDEESIVAEAKCGQENSRSCLIFSTLAPV